ncbi:MAG: hypothetical protein HY360_18650 [Verrucomicrobia bacterium]|nr:hypothetical protein [Verrucomicrobiota bacterium]
MKTHFNGTVFCRAYALFSLGLLLLLPRWLHAQGAVVTYPAAGNIRGEEGTLEMWIRLEAEPDGTTKDGCHYFPIFFVQVEGEQAQRISFSYQTIWKPDFFHFFFSSSGKVMGKITGNPYVTTAEDTQKVLKGDRPNAPYPRLPRLHKDEWHYLALTWKDLPQSTVSLYFDSRLVIPQVTLPASLWDDLENSSIMLMGYNYHDNITVDDFRISSVTRTEKEIAAAFKAGELKADKFTLFLDRFENVLEGEDTRPEVMSGADKASKRGVLNGKFAESVPGKTGKGLKILKF